MIIFFIMSTVLLFLVCCALLMAIGALCFYLIRFARIIFSIEDHLSSTVQSLIEIETSQRELLETQFYFESPELKKALDDILKNIQFSRQAVILLINDFTKLSKEKYITSTVKNDEEEDDEEDSEEGE
jgi:hypothetical protein